MKHRRSTLDPATVRLADFVENPDNPSSATEEDIARLAGKLRRVPLGLTAMRIAYVTDKVEGKRVVISGNKRLRVLKQAYGEDGTIPVDWTADVTAMSEAERHEFIVTANTSDGSWDVDKLLAQYDRAELGDLLPRSEVDALLADFDKTADGDASALDDSGKYSDKIGSPQYEIKGDRPTVAELADQTKYRELLAEVDAAADVPDEVRDFLRLAALRHVRFDYAAVAEYYAHAPANVQRLMERSALVIIDYDDAVQNGYVKLNATMRGIREAEGADEEGGEA